MHVHTHRGACHHNFQEIITAVRIASDLDEQLAVWMDEREEVEDEKEEEEEEG